MTHTRAANSPRVTRSMATIPQRIAILDDSPTVRQLLTSLLETAGYEVDAYSSWPELEQAIQQSEAEAWVVACTTAAHVPVTRQLLEAGKTVLLEKPVADNLDEATSLRPLVKPASSNLMIGHIVLFNSE